MKSILISENENHTSLLFSALTESGIETIRYRWFLKALDNIEEISPDFIVIDAEDFPRHWKILSGYTRSAVFQKPVKIVLYSEKEFSEEEKQKISALGISKTIVSGDKEDIKRKLAGLFEKDYSAGTHSAFNHPSNRNPVFSAPEKFSSGEDYFLPTADNLFYGGDFLMSVDNLFENFEGDFKEDGFMQEFSLDGENSDEYLDRKGIENFGEDYEEDDEVPTVNAIFKAHNIELPFSENGTIESRQISEEDIQNENTLYSVDSLFGLEDNGYPIRTVDNLFYEPDGCGENLPKDEKQCKKLLGSLLRRIQEFYE